MRSTSTQAPPSSFTGSRLLLLDALDRLEQEHPRLVAPLVYRDLCQLECAEIAERLGVTGDHAVMAPRGPQEGEGYFGDASS